jgi:hypothetical protein
MKGRIFIAIMAIGGLLVLQPLAVAAAEQSKDPEQKSTIHIVHVGQDATYDFISSEVSFPGKMVKGAPFSAKAITRTAQILSDGNRIVRQTTSSVHRDSEGRTRREQMLPTIGPWAPENDEVQLISIHDPVKGVGYTLYPKDKTAKKMSEMVFTVTSKDEEGKVITVKTSSEGKASASASATVVATSPKIIHESEVHTGAHWHIRSVKEGEGSEVTEDLGTQTIEGVQAEGKRTIRTIPAGEIGNEYPIEIVTETWHSPDLEMVVLRIHKDPRFGETEYRLTEISREEPDPSLFEIPANFRIESGSAVIHLDKTKKPH